LAALNTLAEPGGDVHKAWGIVTQWSSGEAENVEIEASASCFLHGFMSIVLSLSKSLDGTPPQIQQRNRDLSQKTYQRILDGLQSVLKPRTGDTSEPSRFFSEARHGWINQSHFAVAKFLLHAMSTCLIESSSDLTLIRSMIFSLLSRLLRGNESIAAIIFSSDALFNTCGNPLQEEASSHGASPISSLFLGELCGSERARGQLDHSFKLQHGFGLTSSGFGPFGSYSLLSTVDQPSAPAAGDGVDTLEDHLLPLGRNWLWQIFSGSARTREGASAAGLEEATDVIAAALQLILDQDEAEEVMLIGGYSTQIPVGSKLYYLMNICLQSEEVLNDDRIMESGEALLDRYLKEFGANDSDVVTFCQECLCHSAPKNKVGNGEEKEEETALNERDQKVLEDFVNNKDMSTTPHQISKEELRSLEAFLEDMSKSYREYGAQFDFCTKCIRVFLLPSFPPSIRCRVLQEMDGMVHLLTLPKELEIETEMAQLLLRSVPGGLPEADSSLRDGSDILNKVNGILALEPDSLRPLHGCGYVTTYCIALLARNLGSCLTSGSGVQAAKRRLQKLDSQTVEIICRATKLFLQNGGKRDALVDAVLKSLSDLKNEMELSRHSVDPQFVEKCVEQCITPSN